MKNTVIYLVLFHLLIQITNNVTGLFRCPWQRGVGM